MKCGGMSPREYNLLQQRSNYEWHCTKSLFTTLPYAKPDDLTEELTEQPSVCTDTALVNLNWNEPDLVEQRKSCKHDLLMIHLNINSIQNKFDELKLLNKGLK